METLASIVIMQCVNYNEEVLVHANMAKSILKMIWHRKYRWLEHVLRHESLLHNNSGLIQRRFCNKPQPS